MKKIKAAYGRQISEKQLYQILQKFDILYAEMTDIEKKEFMQLFIDAIELYPEKIEYSCAVTPQVRQMGNRLSGLAGTAYASLLA